jgi:phosphatidylserine/phosphatidylglycerophosphate/cardiolipin synthase-like enzyme
MATASGMTNSDVATTSYTVKAATPTISPPGGTYTSPVTVSTMHAKCVIVDDCEVLITSANFTGRAQHDNIELGVLIRDAEFAAWVSGQWHTLVTRGFFRSHERDADVR